MAISLTKDEMREVALAIDAYRDALERVQATHTVTDCILALKSARLKIAKECEETSTAGSLRSSVASALSTK
jgi:hypothetical protein